MNVFVENSWISIALRSTLPLENFKFSDFFVYLAIKQRFCFWWKLRICPWLTLFYDWVNELSCFWKFVVVNFFIKSFLLFWQSRLTLGNRFSDAFPLLGLRRLTDRLWSHLFLLNCWLLSLFTVCNWLASWWKFVRACIASKLFLIQNLAFRLYLGAAHCQKDFFIYIKFKKTP